MTENITLKWGTIKAWHDINDDSVGILKRYFKDGIPLGCASDKPDKNRRKILCEFIDSLQDNCTIWLDWENKTVSKDKAKEYINNYGEAE